MHLIDRLGSWSGAREMKENEISDQVVRIIKQVERSWLMIVSSVS